MNLRLRLEAVCGSKQVRGDRPLVVGPPTLEALRGALAAASEAQVPAKLAGLRAGEEVAVTFELSAFDTFELLPSSGLLRVGAGIPVSEVEQQLKKEGRSLRWGHLPPIPMGVWLAAHAGAVHSPRALPGHSPVAGLEAVLWDGTPVHTRLAPRSATGPELPAFFLGTRARFGMITELTLRIFPRPPETRRLAWSFADHAVALGACVALLDAGLWPDAMGLRDDAGGVQLSWVLAETAVELAGRQSAAEIIGRSCGGQPVSESFPCLAGASEIRAASRVQGETPGGTRAWLRYSQVLELLSVLRTRHAQARLHLEAVAPEGAAAWVEGLDTQTLEPLLASIGAVSNTPTSELAFLDAVAEQVRGGGPA